MYIKELIEMKKEERTLLHERMKAVAKEGMNEGAWAGIDPYHAYADLYRASTNLHSAVALAIGLYCCVGLAVKIAELLRR